MANQRAWEDFSIVGNINRVKSDIQELARNIDKIEKKKDEIWNDPARKAEFKKLVEEHHDSEADTITKLAAIYTKLKTLKDWLEQNTYLS